MKKQKSKQKSLPTVYIRLHEAIEEVTALRIANKNLTAQLDEYRRRTEAAEDSQRRSLRVVIDACR